MLVFRCVLPFISDYFEHSIFSFTFKRIRVIKAMDLPMTKSNLRCLIVFVLCLSRLQALTITGYSADANNRFASGFPLTPVENTNSAFVGLGYDWSGVAWSTSTYTSSSYKGLGMLSPQHFLTAQHYEYNATRQERTNGVRVLNEQGLLITSGTVSSISNTGQGLVLTNQSITNPDVAIGTLSTPLAQSGTIARMGVLDLHNSSGANTLGNYSTLPIFLYGRSNTTNGSPRVGTTTIDQIGAWADDPNQLVFLTVRSNQVQFEPGDSGAPALHGWTNPNGGKELTVVGVNSAFTTDNVYNIVSLLSSTAAMNATNTIMTNDGFALRVVGNIFGTWNGGNGANASNLGTSNNWSNNSAQGDRYVLFDSNQTNIYNLNVNSTLNFRGLYFRETASTTDGFSFGGSNTLTVGRGGITNYDIARQVFTASITLGDHQYWDVGQGGITVTNLNTNGRLLEIAGAGTARLNGVVSGSGGLAVSGARVELMGANTYTGNTWIHSGVLNVDGSLSTSSQVRIGADGRLEGSGSVGQISGSGSVDPGNSPGILTATSVDPSGGLSFNFEFTSTGSPDYGAANASVNDVLRLTGGIPFSSGLTSANEIHLFLDVPGISAQDTFRGGFYTDNPNDFLSFIQNGSFAWYLADVGGEVSYNGVQYSLYTGPLLFEVSTVAESADFGAGLVEGQVMQFVVIPEPGTLILFGLTGLAAALGFWIRRPR